MTNDFYDARFSDEWQEPWDTPSVDKVEFYKDGAGEWRWRYVRSNGKTIADSGEGYHNLGDAQGMAHYLFDSKYVSFELVVEE